MIKNTNEKLSSEEIKTLQDLKNFLGIEKLTKFFIEHYLKAQAKNLQDIKLDSEDNLTLVRYSSNATTIHIRN